MKELSIFIDESGDFGVYSHHSPYYIITMVFHDQNSDIQPAVEKLKQGIVFSWARQSVHTHRTHYTQGRSV